MLTDKIEISQTVFFINNRYTTSHKLNIDTLTKLNHQKIFYSHTIKSENQFHFTLKITQSNLEEVI